MTERSYTVAEIDALRKACELRWLHGSTAAPLPRMSHAYYPADKDRGVEEMVRTYMLAGITAAEIYAEDQKRSEGYRKQSDANDAFVARMGNSPTSIAERS